MSLVTLDVNVMLQIKFLGKFISSTIGISNKNAKSKKKKSDEFKIYCRRIFLRVFIYLCSLFLLFCIIGGFINDVISHWMKHSWNLLELIKYTWVNFWNENFIVFQKKLFHSTTL